VLTVEEARSSGIGQLLDAHTQPDDEKTYLLAFLLQEKERGEDSFWKPYLDVLPRSFPTHPFFFDEHELLLLNGSFLRGLAGFQRKSQADRHAHLCQHVPGFERFSFAEFVWAHFAVVSRAFSVTQDGHTSSWLVPLVDMINDGRPWNSQWSMLEDEQFFEVRAAGAVAGGTELLTRYGARSNLELLLQYGFVYEDNTHDEVPMFLGIPLEDPLAGEKQRLLGFASPIEQRSYRLMRTFDLQLMAEIVSLLRVAHADAGELAKLAEAPGALTLAKPLSGEGDEQKLIAVFAAICEERLAGYETSLEEVERILRGE
jgi:histone-lysine N-methyltransferase SETD3